jgi:hypothetical protein
VIDVAESKAGLLQAESDRTFGQLMRIVEFGRLAMLDPVEALLFGGGNELAADQKCCGRLVIHRIDSKDVHRTTSPLCCFHITNIIPSSGISCLPIHACWIDRRQPNLSCMNGS